MVKISKHSPALSKEKTNQPHDQFFKYVFSNSETARTFLINYLPPEVSTLLDYSTLQIYKDSFVDEEMKAHLSDLLYQINLKDSSQKLCVYILFEHKSYYDPFVPLQLLRYMLVIWKHFLDEIHKLVGIIPIVFYHGKDAWDIPTNFQSLLDVPAALREYMPEFRYHLVNLSGIADEELKGDEALKAELLVFKYIKRDELKEQLGKVVRLAADISDAQLAKTTLDVILEYLSNAKTVLTNGDVEKVILEVEEERGDKMSNFIEVWIERGKQEGLQQGLQEGLRKGEQEGIKKGLLDGLETALDIKFGIEGLRLMPELHNIKNVELLQTLRSAIKTANSPQELRSIFQ